MKIVVRGTNWIGDAVMTVPALTELRRAFPLAHITLQTRPLTADIFADAGFIDEILPIDVRGSKISNFITQSRELRERQFDLGISLTNSFESAAIQRNAGIPARFGYATQGRRLLLTDPVPIPKWKGSRHEVFYYLNLIDAVKAKYLGPQAQTIAEPSLELGVSEARRSAAAGFLAGKGVDGLRPIVALGVGSTNSMAKRWPADRFAALAERLESELNAAILIVGSKADKAAAEEVKRISSASIIDLSGETTVAEAVANLSLADLLITNDMGLAHAGPAVGTRTIVIFGPTDPTNTRPFSKNAEIIRHPVECSPCKFRDCPIDHRCMTAVSVNEVFELARCTIGLE